MKYKKLKPNIVSLKESVDIEVNASASPLFYKIKKVKTLKKITISGLIETQKKISPSQDDSYFQLGIIYAGDYRPNAFVKSFLPEWLKKVLSINEDHGISRIDFIEASEVGRKLDKQDSIRDIKLSFSTGTYIKDSKFNLEIVPRSEKVLGFWLRSDGDDSKAKFKTKILRFSIE